MHKLPARLWLIATQLINIAVAVMVPLAYLTPFGATVVVLPLVGSISIIAVGFPAAIAYVVSNLVMGFARPGDHLDRMIDLTFSLLAALSITATAIAVFGFDVGKEYWGHLPHARLLLGVLVAYAWLIDVYFNQLRNIKEFLHVRGGEPTVAAVAPTQGTAVTTRVVNTEHRHSHTHYHKHVHEHYVVVDGREVPYSEIGGPDVIEETDFEYTYEGAKPPPPLPAAEPEELKPATTTS